jgi:glucose-1-phosphate thymidylyltransferase
MSPIKAVLPVAGAGTRLRPHTLTKPKVLLRIAGKPMLSYIIDELLPLHIEEQIFIIGHRGEEIQEYVTTTYPVKAHFVEQKELLGLGHAVSLAREFVDPGDDLLIILGDTIFELDLKKVIASERSLIGVQEVADPQRFGVVEMEGAAVKRFVEKPETFVSNLAIVGIYYIKKAHTLFDALTHHIAHGTTRRGEYQLTDALQLMVSQGHEFGVFPVAGWFDCGTPEALLSTNRHFLQKHSTRPELQGAQIFPPCYIGKNVALENATVGPHVSIDEGCTIRNSTIRNSIIYDHVSILESTINDSIIGSYAAVEGCSLILRVGDHAMIEKIPEEG